MEKEIILEKRVRRIICLIRGQKVILDRDLAALYEVPTKALKQAVRRNADRFPQDFMFVVTGKELAILRSQSVTSSSWGGTRYLPMAFTEQGGGDVRPGAGNWRKTEEKEVLTLYRNMVRTYHR